MNILAMDEPTVREELVAPWLRELGYRYGTNAHIRREVYLKYSKQQLGRKKPKTDPILMGKADYICEILPTGDRWVIEAKAGSEDLTLDHSEQAHSYASHPEIHASLYLITNGREWKLYKTGLPKSPLLSWTYGQIPAMKLKISNFLSPETIRGRAKRDEFDAGQPLAAGLNSTSRVHSGNVMYEYYVSNDDVFTRAFVPQNMSRAPVENSYIERGQDGKIEASINTLSTAPALDAMTRALRPNQKFITNDEFLSTDSENPNIFTNSIEMITPIGTRFPRTNSTPEVVLQFGMTAKCFTQAVGFLDNDRFIGTFEIYYNYIIHSGGIFDPQRSVVERRLRDVNITSIGSFELTLAKAY